MLSRRPLKNEIFSVIRIVIRLSSVSLCGFSQDCRVDRIDRTNSVLGAHAGPLTIRQVSQQPS